MSITPLRVGSRGEGLRRDASLSERSLTGLIRSLGASTAHPDLALSLARRGEERGSLSAAFLSLSAQEQSTLRSSFGSSTLQEILSLSQENDVELLAEGLLALAGRCEGRGQEGRAELIYAAARDLAANSQPDLARRAESRLAALQGEGAFGARFEVQARRFLREATDPTMIAGMGAAGLMSNAIRLGVLTRFAAQPASWYTRGLGARFGAGALSLVFEAPAFTAGVHGAQTVLGRPQNLSASGLGHELASGYLLIGALRLSGGMTRNLATRYFSSGSGSVGQRLGLGMLEQGGALAAILAANRAEQGLSLRPEASGGAMLMDAFTTLLHFRVGSRLAESTLGPGYHRALQDLQLRSQAVEALPRFPSSLAGLSGLEPALAGARTESRFGSPAEPNFPHILQMSMRPPPKNGSGVHGPTELAAEPGSGQVRLSNVSTLPSAAETLADLRSLAPRARLRRLAEIYQDGRLASLALEAEFQAQRSQIDVQEFATARRRLQVLEGEFEDFITAEAGKTPGNRRWENFQRWQNELYPTDSAGLGRVQQIARAMGLPDLFAFKTGGINLKARVKRDQETADYYHDLYLVRDFLRQRGLNRAELGNENGKFLSNLLLRGDGNCVTLSLLFSHFAARLGRTLDIGLLPRHTFLVAKNGGAIDSILDFGMLLSKPYLARAIEPERRALPAQHLFTVHLLNLGKLGVDRGDAPSAESALSLASELMPNNPRAYLQLGRMHQLSGDAPAAFENFQKVQELHPNDMHRYNSLRAMAWERIAREEYREAESLLRQMNDLQPSDLDVMRALVLVYERSQRPRAAQEIQNILDIMEFDLPGD